MESRIKQKVDNLPEAPGVYFLRENQQILYIGKATSLRSRVRSYFRSDLIKSRSSWIAQMVSRINKIDFKLTDSVLEALILESREIKKHQPFYNTREKDDKSYLYVVITDEDFPRILAVRERNISEQKSATIFGPFPHGGELREGLKIIRKIFPFRDKCKPNSGKPCFDCQIGLCPGICAGTMSKIEYKKTIRHLTLFFQGKKANLIKQLEKEMIACAKKQKFEQAGEIKKQIFALKHIQDVSLIKKPIITTSADFAIEAYDVAHLSGKHTVGVMVAMRHGELAKDSYRRFKLRGSSSDQSDDIANLQEVLNRRLSHGEWLLPELIIVDGGRPQVNAFEKVLRERGLNIPVVGVIKDAHHRASKFIGLSRLIIEHRDSIVALNQEAHRFAINYHRKLRRRMV